MSTRNSVDDILFAPIRPEETVASQNDATVQDLIDRIRKGPPLYHPKVRFPIKIEFDIQEFKKQ